MEFVDVNGLNGGFAYGMVRAGHALAYRAGYLTLGRPIVNANRWLWGEGWSDELDGSASGDDWLEWPMPDRATVLVGVPPCSGFSIMTGMGAARGLTARAGADHEANACMWATVRYGSRHRPQLLMFESVAAAYSKGRGLMQQLHAELERLTGENYQLTHWLHDGVTMGAPTSRQRYMFVAARGDRPFSVQPVESYAPADVPTTLRDAIGDLEELELKAGDQAIEHPDRGGQWARDRQRPDLLVDGHRHERTTWQRRVDETFEQCRQRGIVWEQGQMMDVPLRRLCGANREALDQALLSENLAERLEERDFNFGTFPIKREAYDSACYLITGGGSTYHVHPTEDRNLTFRELARVQGWPDELRIDFDQKVYGHEKLPAVWGKAVGCLVAEHAGQQVAQWLAGETTGRDEGELIGPRERILDELGPSRRLRQLIAKRRRDARSSR